MSKAAILAGDLDRGTQAAAQSLAVARQLGSSHPFLLRALLDYGTVILNRDGPWPGLSLLSEAREVAHKIHEDHLEGDLCIRCGILRIELGNLEGARRDLETAQQIGKRSESQHLFASALSSLAWVLWKQGYMREARETINNALEHSRQARMLQLELLSRCYLTLFDVITGESMVALEQTQRIREEAARKSYGEPQTYAAMAAALCLLSIGRFREAAETAVDATTAYTALGGTRQFGIELYLIASLCLTATNQPREAQVMKEKGRALLKHRLAPILDLEARTKLIKNISAGLPREIQIAIAEISDPDR